MTKRQGYSIHWFSNFGEAYLLLLYIPHMFDTLVTGQKLEDESAASPSGLHRHDILSIVRAFVSIFGDECLQFFGSTRPVGIVDWTGARSVLTIYPVQDWSKDLPSYGQALQSLM